MKSGAKVGKENGKIEGEGKQKGKGRWNLEGERGREEYLLSFNFISWNFHKSH